MNTILLKAMAVCVLSVLGIAACSSGGQTPVEKGIEQQVLHIGNGSEPSGIDPHTTTGMPEFHIQMALFEGLVSKHPETLAPVPAVAESWQISEDGTKYTFKIRDDARWSNGDDLTADDFVWSWKRALSPALGNQYAYSLFVIDNAEQYYLGKLTDFAAVGIKALDQKTLEIKLANPTPYFLDLLDHHSMYPIHRKSVEQSGSFDDRGAQWAIPGKLVSNGPFTLKEWQPNKILVVEKNPLYWDAAEVELKEIHFHPVDNVATEERMFRAGQLHKTNSLPIEKIAGYRASEAPELRLHPYVGTYYYQLNTNVKPLNDPRVRKALAMSIDRDTLVDKVTKGGQLPAYNFTPPDLNGYTAEAKIEFNVEKARELLAQAGYPNGEGFPKLEILFNTLEDHQKIAVTIQQMWKQALNVDVTMQNQDWKVYLSNTRTGNYEIARAAWVGDYLDPNTFLNMFVTDGGNNKTGWSNARYDELIAKANSTLDQQQRYQIFQEAERILMDELPLIPIYTYTYKYLLHPAVKGWYDNIMDYHPYKYVSLVPPNK